MGGCINALTNSHHLTVRIEVEAGAGRRPNTGASPDGCGGSRNNPKQFGDGSEPERRGDNGVAVGPWRSRSAPLSGLGCCDRPMDHGAMSRGWAGRERSRHYPSAVLHEHRSVRVVESLSRSPKPRSTQKSRCQMPKMRFELNSRDAMWAMNVPILARNLSHHAAKRPAIQFSRSLTSNNRSDLDMTAFLILPAADLSADNGWIVKSIHENGVVETSVIYETGRRYKC
jgi:hypothetical protein